MHTTVVKRDRETREIRCNEICKICALRARLQGPMELIYFCFINYRPMKIINTPGVTRVFKSHSKWQRSVVGVVCVCECLFWGRWISNSKMASEL